MHSMLLAELAVLAEFHTIRVIFLVFHRIVIPLLALGAG